MQYMWTIQTKPFYIVTSSDLKPGDTWPLNLKLFLLMNVAVGGPWVERERVDTQPWDYDGGLRSAVSAFCDCDCSVLGNPPPISIKAGATTGNTSTFTPGLAPGTGFVYFSCSTDAPKSSCSIATTDPLNTHVLSSSATESVTVTVYHDRELDSACVLLRSQAAVPPAGYSRSVSPLG